MVPAAKWEPCLINKSGQPGYKISPLSRLVGSLHYSVFVAVGWLVHNHSPEWKETMWRELMFLICHLLSEFMIRSLSLTKGLRLAFSILFFPFQINQTNNCTHFLRRRTSVTSRHVQQETIHTVLPEISAKNFYSIFSTFSGFDFGLLVRCLSLVSGGASRVARYIEPPSPFPSRIGGVAGTKRVIVHFYIPSIKEVTSTFPL